MLFPLNSVYRHRTIKKKYVAGEQLYLLSYKRNDQDKTVLFPCEKLSKSGILSLAKNGVDVTENNATVLLDCLQNQRFNLVHGENNKKSRNQTVTRFSLSKKRGIAYILID
jgi:tRNA U34 2-thiouridine synthase MnmA/TrmU